MPKTQAWGRQDIISKEEKESSEAEPRFMEDTIASHYIVQSDRVQIHITVSLNCCCRILKSFCISSASLGKEANSLAPTATGMRDSCC